MPNPGTDRLATWTAGGVGRAGAGDGDGARGAGRGGAGTGTDTSTGAAGAGGAYGICWGAAGAATRTARRVLFRMLDTTPNTMTAIQIASPIPPIGYFPGVTGGTGGLWSPPESVPMAERISVSA